MEVHILYPRCPQFEWILLGKSTVHLRTGHAVPVGGRGISLLFL